MLSITNRKGQNHVTSAQFRDIIQSIVGHGSYIANLYNLMEPELSTNNKIKIKSGLLIHHGYMSEIQPGTYDEINYQNGTQGMLRVDLVVARYRKNEDTQIEDMEWVVIQGTPDESNPVVPDYIVGNMQEGDLTDDCPVFEIHFDGINVTEVKKLLPTIPSADGTQNDIDSLYSKLEKSGNVTLLCSTKATSFQQFSIAGLHEYKYFVLACSTESANRLLSTILIPSMFLDMSITPETVCESVYSAESSLYKSQVYFNSALNLVFLKSASQYDSALLYGIT